MRKVGIITLNGYYNYGNRLQNYATQEVVRSFGFEPETIMVESPKKKLVTLSDRIMRFTFSKLQNKIERRLCKNLIMERCGVFKEFTERYINETSYSISDDRIPDDIGNRYEFFITGSDQVWNPKNINGSSIYFLSFAPKQKRVAYAPSFGVSSISEEYTKAYVNWLSEIESISVREHAGAEIIKKLTGRDSVILIDPTMMLTREEWLSISHEASSKPKNSKYLLTYFLGKLTGEDYKYIKKIARKNHLEILNLATLKNKDLFTAGPAEFIDFINSASLFCTDSFHGVIFSILMETPFIVFERKGSVKSMYSRIDTLLKTFELESRKSSELDGNHQIFGMDFSHIQPILKLERTKAVNFLKHALDLEDYKVEI